MNKICYVLLSVKVKNIAGKEDMECYGGEGCSFRQSALRGCTEKVTFKSRPEESDHVDVFGRSVPNRGKLSAEALG